MNKPHKIHMVSLITLIFLIGIISNSSIIAETYPSQDTMNANVLDQGWFQQVQVYDMVAFPPNDIDRFHITVNGLWNGFIGENLSSPFAFGRLLESFFSGRVYETDDEFVSTQHDQGMIVPGTILTTQGHVSFQGEQMEDYACRSVDGQLCFWDLEAESYWMNANNPGFIDWCIKHGKKAIDADADMIVLDEIQGNSLVPIFQYASQFIGVPAPGYSNYTIEGFRLYLKDTYSSAELLNLFDIEDIDIYDLRTRIAETMNLAYYERISKDSLIKDYITYLDESNFQAKKRLIEELRTYASEVDKDIIIGANSYTLGTSRVGGFWPKGLHFADLVDVFTFENAYTVFFDQPLPRFYRNKWLAWEKLAYASTNAPAIILVDTSAFEAINKPLFPIRGYSNYLAILCAEAYANKGCFVNYYFRLLNRGWNWKGCRAINEFILDNKDLYDLPSYIPTEIAILYLYGEGMHNKSNTYLGCAQALAESQIPFDVIFDGDGQYINESLNSSDLSYTVLVIPSVIDITVKQETLIKEYVASGGIAIVFDPEEIGFAPVEGEVTYGNGSFYFFLEDKGSLYFQTYNNKYRGDLVSVIKNYSDEGIYVQNAKRRIIAYPYYQDERLILHLVNYDRLGIIDFVWPKFSIDMQIKKPPFDVGRGYVISPHFSKKEDLNLTITENHISFTVPYLRIYNVIIFEKASG